MGLQQVQCSGTHQALTTLLRSVTHHRLNKLLRFAISVCKRLLHAAWCSSVWCRVVAFDEWQQYMMSHSDMPSLCTGSVKPPRCESASRLEPAFCWVLSAATVRASFAWGMIVHRCHALRFTDCPVAAASGLMLCLCMQALSTTTHMTPLNHQYPIWSPLSAQSLRLQLIQGFADSLLVDESGAESALLRRGASFTDVTLPYVPTLRRVLCQCQLPALHASPQSTACDASLPVSSGIKAC